MKKTFLFVLSIVAFHSLDAGKNKSDIIKNRLELKKTTQLKRLLLKVSNDFIDSGYLADTDSSKSSKIIFKKQGKTSVKK